MNDALIAPAVEDEPDTEAHVESNQSETEIAHEEAKFFSGETAECLLDVRVRHDPQHDQWKEKCHLYEQLVPRPVGISLACTDVGDGRG